MIMKLPVLEIMVLSFQPPRHSHMKNDNYRIMSSYKKRVLNKSMCVSVKWPVFTTTKPLHGTSPRRPHTLWSAHATIECRRYLYSHIVNQGQPIIVYNSLLNQWSLLILYYILLSVCQFVNHVCIYETICVNYKWVCEGHNLIT